MYKLLLSWRYLKTRFIALASIVSVTLGVATLIVVNSVMAGFVDQMQSRLHGILSDVEVAAPLLGEITYPKEHVAVIRELLGDDVEEVTCVVRNPALLSFEFHGRQWTQQVMLMGIDDETFGKVTDFEPYLTNELKRGRFSFELEEKGYESKYGPSGWDYRRKVADNKKQLAELMQQHQNAYDVAAASYMEQTDPNGPIAKVKSIDGERKVQLRPLPAKVPKHGAAVEEDATIHQAATIPDSALAKTQKVSPFDPHAKLRPQVDPEDMFDADKDQYTGIILGQAISKRKTTDADGEIVDLYMVRPGDDVQIMFPSVG